MLDSTEDHLVRGPSFPAAERLKTFKPARTHLNKHAIVGFDSYDSRSRPFHIMRTQLAKRIAAQNLNMIGVTSATPAAGKSFLSLNLAASLARVSEEPVYLVDLDFRRGSVAKDLGLTIETGIADYLSGDAEDLADIGWRLEGTKLGVFPTGYSTHNSAELLASDRFTRMMAAISSSSGGATFLFDLPPSFAGDDTMIAMQHLESYILVVDSGVTTRKQLEQTLAMLQPTPCVGTVLNRYVGAVVDDYGYGYGYGYGKQDYSKYY